MGFLALYVYRYLGNIVDVSLSLIAAICIGGLIYFALVFYLRVPEVERILEAIKYRLWGRLERRGKEGL
jgi:uncharacterized protein (DUF1919 family)